MLLHDKKLKKLEKVANEIRKDIIRMLEHAGSGHSAGPLGMADVFTALYFHVLHHNPKKPNWPERDRLVMSNGHICPVRYAVMAHAGYFPKKELMTLRRLGSRLQGHPERSLLPGLETSNGPLGQGLSQAIGMALALRMDEKSVGRRKHVYCVMSDGEHQEGQIWEAIMAAGKYKLHNLTGIIDRNNIQIDGYTEDVMPLESLVDKYKAFGWHVIEVDGHNIRAFVDACEQAKSIFEKPMVIIAHTIPGRGVSYMENDYLWHGNPPNEEQARQALSELRTLGGKIHSEHE
ncbi:MAG: transketolase [bacterium]|nr:transketolase [bacterium]